MNDVILKEEVRGWVIFCLNSNRPYSKLLDNNDLKPIYYSSPRIAKEEAEKLGYNILGYKKWD